ncbi:MAG: hypothetical protein WBC15_20610 [Mycobacterium sp.]
MGLEFIEGSPDSGPPIPAPGPLRRHPFVLGVLALIVFGRVDLLGFGQDLLGHPAGRNRGILRRRSAELSAQGCLVAIGEK